MYRPPTALQTLVSVPVVRLAADERQKACQKCQFYVPASDLAFRFELEAEKIALDLMLCGHPGCGCWKNRGRLDPWKRPNCPDRKW
jgi:hypothetical protein